MLIVWFFAYKKLAQFAVRGALPPRRSESPVCATDNKPSCVSHLLGWFIGSRGLSSLERRPEFWVLQLTLKYLLFFFPFFSSSFRISPSQHLHGLLPCFLQIFAPISLSTSLTISFKISHPYQPSAISFLLYFSSHHLQSSDRLYILLTFLLLSFQLDYKSHEDKTFVSFVLSCNSSN